MKKDFSFLGDVCHGEEPRVLFSCEYKVLVRKKGSWTDLCKRRDIKLKTRVKRYFQVERSCPPFRKLFYQKTLFFF